MILNLEISAGVGVGGSVLTVASVPTVDIGPSSVPLSNCVSGQFRLSLPTDRRHRPSAPMSTYFFFFFSFPLSLFFFLSFSLVFFFFPFLFSFSFPFSSFSFHFFLPTAARPMGGGGVTPPLATALRLTRTLICSNKFHELFRAEL